MKPHRFFVCLVLALGVVYAFNIVLALRFDSVSRLIMRKMQATPQIDVLLLGNSLMQTGLDPDTLDAAWPAAGTPPHFANAGLGGASPVEHYLLAQQAYLHHRSIPFIIYGFYDLQLTTPPQYGWGDLIGNRSMAYSLDPIKAASLYSPGSTWEKWRFRLIGAIPMLSWHFQLWKSVEVFRRTLQEFGMPKVKTNAFGRISDFEALAATQKNTFDPLCEKAVENSAPFIPPIQELFKLAREQKTQVIVVEMPLGSGHRNLYYSSNAWRQYRAYIQEQLKLEGISYVMASDWVPDDADFSDGLHLNEEGTRVFSTKMASVLADAIHLH